MEWVARARKVLKGATFRFAISFNVNARRTAQKPSNNSSGSLRKSMAVLEVVIESLGGGV